MRGPTEETLVDNGHPQDRQLQAGNQYLYRRRQLAILENKVEQHGDQTDNVVIHARHGLATATARALLLQQPLDLLTQAAATCIAGKVLGRHTRQNLQQLIALHRHCSGTRQPGQRHIAAGHAPLADQLAEHPQDFLLLVAAIAGARCNRGGRLTAPFTSASRSHRTAGLGHRRQTQIRHDASIDQRFIKGFVKTVDAVEHTALKQLQNDQPHLDVDIQRLQGLGKMFNQRGGSKGAIALVHAPSGQAVDAQGEVTQGGLITCNDATNHAIDSNRLFKLIRLHQRQRVQLKGYGLRRSRRIAGKLLGSQHHAITGFSNQVGTLQANAAHGFKEKSLLGVTGGLVGHLEQRVVCLVEYLAKAVLQIAGGLIPDRQQRRRQQGGTCRRARRQIGLDGNHLGVLGHVCSPDKGTLSYQLYANAKCLP